MTTVLDRPRSSSEPVHREGGLAVSDVVAISDTAGPDVQLSVCEWMFSHIIGDRLQCLALCLVHRDHITRSKGKLPPFHCHTTSWQREAKHDAREQNLLVFGQCFHCHKFPSNGPHYDLGVIHDAVLDGDVPHHQTQAVQFQFQMVVGTPGGFRECRNSSVRNWLRWVSSEARRVTLCSKTSCLLTFFKIFSLRSSTTALVPVMMARSLHRLMSFTSGKAC